MELQVGLTALLTWFPSLRLAVPEEELPWRRATAVPAHVDASVHLRAVAAGCLAQAVTLLDRSGAEIEF